MINVNNRSVARTWNGLVNELFNDVENSLGTLSTVHQRSFPAINVVENNEGYHAELLAPGRNKAYFNVLVEKNELVIKYEAPAAEKNNEVKQVRHEFSINNFTRKFLLDEKVDAENIQAKYEDGLLKIFLPKKADLRPATLSITIQ